MASPPTAPTEKRLRPELEPLLHHLDLDPIGVATLTGCTQTEDALRRLQQAGLLIEATRLFAHALPPRQAVWWACACTRHTAPADPALADKLRTAAEEWVRRQSDGFRRAAMAAAEDAGFDTAEAWAAVAAFWSGDSLAPVDAPKVPPQPHFTGLAVSGAVALAAVRAHPERRETRLKTFLAAAWDIAGGGVGRMEPEAG